MYYKKTLSFFQESNFATALSKVAVKLFLPLVIGVIACVVFGAYSVTLEQDAHWDLLNYRYYAGFTLWEGFALWEIEQQPHIMPAQIQSFFNPLSSLPAYLLITYFPPIFIGFLLGFIHGLNFLLVYLLSRQILFNRNDTSIISIKQSLIALTIAVVGVTAPMFISEIGTTIDDNLTSIFVLAALLFVFKKSASHPWLYPLISGLFIGMAAGLKLTNAVFLIGLVGCGWWYKRSNLRQTLAPLGFLLIGAILAFLLFHGYWNWYLFQEYQNPLFPFFNNFFQSPHAEPASYSYGFRDIKKTPDSFLSALSYPFKWALESDITSDGKLFRDLRFALLSILFFLSIPIVIIRIIRQRSPPLPIVKFNLIFFFLISYSVWILVFASQRYIIVLELLSGLIIYFLIEIIIKTPKYRVLVFVPLAILLVATTNPPDWGRTPWGSTWFEIEIPDELTADEQLFVMVRDDGISYVIPFFPSDSRFVRIDGNIRPSKKLAEHVRQTMENHQGPIYAIYAYSSWMPKHPTHREIRSLQNYGLITTKKNCIYLHPKAIFDPIAACPLEHINSESK